MAKWVTVTTPASCCVHFDITEMLVIVGDQIVVEQPLLRLDTEKAYLDYPSPYSGRITQILVSIGDRVSPGDPLLIIEIGDDVASSGSSA